MKQHIPLGQSACNLLPRLHPTFPLLLWEEEASDLRAAFSSHLQQTGLKVWSGGDSDFALDETISRPSHGPLPPARPVGDLILQFTLFQVFRHQSGRRHFPESLCLVSLLK